MDGPSVLSIGSLEIAYTRLHLLHDVPPASPHSPHKHLACQSNGMEQDKVDSVATHLEMTDAKHISGKNIEGSALLVNKQGGVRKLPVPSDSPNDPLNWSV